MRSHPPTHPLPPPQQPKVGAPQPKQGYTHSHLLSTNWISWFQTYPVIVETSIFLHLFGRHQVKQFREIILLINFVQLAPHVNWKIAGIKLIKKQEWHNRLEKNTIVYTPKWKYKTRILRQMKHFQNYLERLNLPPRCKVRFTANQLQDDFKILIGQNYLHTDFQCGWYEPQCGGPHTNDRG